MFPDIENFINGQVAVSQTAFDRVALEQSRSFRGTRSLACRWLDSARVQNPQISVGGKSRKQRRAE